MLFNTIYSCYLTQYITLDIYSYSSLVGASRSSWHRFICAAALSRASLIRDLYCSSASATVTPARAPHTHIELIQPISCASSITGINHSSINVAKVAGKVWLASCCYSHSTLSTASLARVPAPFQLCTDTG